MKFVANDGKIFDTMEDCEAYELEHGDVRVIEDTIRKTVAFYDVNGKHIEFTSAHGAAFWDEFEHIIGDTNNRYVALYGNEIECEKIFDYVDNELSECFPSEKGLYIWTNDDHWASFNEEKEDFIKRWKSFYPRLHIEV